MQPADFNRLQQHFSNGINTPDRWEELWKDNFAPWDRGQASPALFDLMKERKDLVGEAWTTDANGQKRRKRLLVPGCGRGYEALLLATFGYDGYGLDGADGAVIAGKKLVEDTFDGLPMEEGAGGKGKVEFVKGDFFKNDWEKELGLEGEKYDMIYDYTVSLFLTSM